MHRLLVNALLLLLAAGAGSSAQARSDDRDQPLDVDAEKVDGELTDNGTMRLIGSVIIQQGTLDVRADAAVVTTRNGEIHQVVLTGNPVRMHQLDDAGTPTDARARKVDYRLTEERITLTGDAHIEQPRGSISGEHIVYDMRNGRMDGGSEGSRVQLRLLPAKKDEAEEKPSDGSAG